MSESIKIILDNGESIFIDSLQSSQQENIEAYEDGIEKTSALSSKIKDAMQSAVEKSTEVATLGINKTSEIITISGEKISNTIAGFSNQLHTGFSELPKQNQPNKVKIEFNIEFTSNAEIKIASFSSKGLVKVIAEWDH